MKDKIPIKSGWLELDMHNEAHRAAAMMATPIENVSLNVEFKTNFDKENGVWYKFFVCGFDEKPMIGVSISDSENFMGTVLDSSLQHESYNVALKNFKELKEKGFAGTENKS